MKIAIANDHRGVEQKNKIINYLKSRNLEYINYGYDGTESVDYVDYAKILCDGLNAGEADLGILICGTGIGMSISANKIHGIRAGKVSTPSEAALTREHNAANVIALAEYTENVEEIVAAFIDTKVSTEERHMRRVEKINQLS